MSRHCLLVLLPGVDRGRRTLSRFGIEFRVALRHQAVVRPEGHSQWQHRAIRQREVAHPDRDRNREGGLAADCDFGFAAIDSGGLSGRDVGFDPERLRFVRSDINCIEEGEQRVRPETDVFGAGARHEGRFDETDRNGGERGAGQRSGPGR